MDGRTERSLDFGQTGCQQKAVFESGPDPQCSPNQQVPRAMAESVCFRGGKEYGAMGRDAEATAVRTAGTRTITGDRLFGTLGVQPNLGAMRRT
ncbi:MAG: hypothetical protein BVN33_01375 [Proteobacteria bacterium ST_bin13]|nr:MAG: hypothetical protein BVN33_01375 [Proteobacteria bacterium ST_bin13]